MDPILVGIAGLVLILVLMSQRVPVAMAMMVVGFIGLVVLNSWQSALATLVTETWSTLIFYEFIVIPLFILMGNFASISGMSRDLYGAAYSWFGHWRGGLALGNDRRVCRLCRPFRVIRRLRRLPWAASPCRR